MVTISFTREINLYKPVLELFENQYKAYIEVPFIRKSVDLVLFERNVSESIVAVEFKLKDWKRALVQAATNQLFTDESYIAMPSSYINNVFDRGLQRNLNLTGIGLISVDRDAIVKVSANRMKLVLEHHRRRVIKSIEVSVKALSITREEIEDDGTRNLRRTAAFLPSWSDARAGIV